MKPFASRLAALALATLAAACGSSGDSRGESADTGHYAVASKPGHFGVNIDPANPQANPTGAELAAVGARRVRIEFKVEGDLQAAFATYDAILGQRIGAGTGVLFILDYATLGGDSNSWASDGYRDTFAARAAQIAAHYAPMGVDHFEIWNEEDLCAGGGYCPYVEPGRFGALLGAAATAIHGVAPGARVALGGLGSGNWEGYLGSVVSAMGGAWASVDAVAIHPYLHWPRESGMGGNELEYMLDRCHSIGNRPLWLTEWGDAGQQAATERAYFDFFAAGSDSAEHVEEAYLFAWSDAQESAPRAFGLFDRDGNKKAPEWNAFHDASAGVGALPPPPPPPPPSGPSCGELASQKGWSQALCEWNGNGACGGQGEATSDCEHCCEAGSPPPPPPQNSCGCQAGIDNFCALPPNTDGCDMTAPGGYCDPNGDGSYDDADWVRGWNEHHAACP